VVLGPAIGYLGAAGHTNSVLADRPVPTPDEEFVRYPILAVPVGGALAATGYHLASGQSFDRAAATLGLVVLVLLAARQSFAAIDLRRFARRVARREAHYRSLLAGSSDVTLVLDENLVVRWQSPAAARQFGLSDQDVVGRPFAALVHPEDGGRVGDRLHQLLAAPPAEPGPPILLPARLRDGFGRWRDTESTVSDQRSVPAVGALVVSVRDVGQRDLERTLPATAYTDELTGLANRRQLTRTVAGLRSVPGQPGSLLFIELSGVTAISEVHGRVASDAVLVEVGRRLRAAVTGADLVARLSDGLFAITTAHPPVPAYALASRVREVLGQSFQLPGSTVRLTASIGLAELAAATSVGDALSRADLALCRARQLHSTGIEWYDEVLAAALHRRRALARELPGVVDRGELDLLFQPVLDLADGTTVGAETVLRWRHPQLGAVAAADLVPVAEDLDLLDEIGAWQLHCACRQLACWLREGWDLWLGIHLAAGQLSAPQLTGMVSAALRSHQVPAERLILEVPERGLGSDLTWAVDPLAELRALGVRTALAQFGTGSTPLASLRRLPVDLLKVDRAMFMAPAEPARAEPEVMPIMDAVVELSRRLGLEVVAEGLDATAQVDQVRAAGCRYGQGVVFGGPSPAEHFEAYLETHRTATA
jgi:diguanylate cyclase (GGDEF)-like protein/PAS domain S-box-containing protein